MKKWIPVILILLACAYLFLYHRNISSDKADTGTAEGLSTHARITPETITYDIKNVENIKPDSYFLQDENNIYYYSSLDMLEKDFDAEFLKPDVNEYDTGGMHIMLFDEGDYYTVDYNVGKKRDNTKTPFQYLTWENGFITLKSVPEPVFPENGDDKEREEYYDASRDYWDSTEYYQVTMTLFKDTDAYDSTLLMNRDSGNIVCNEEHTNSSGVKMTIRGYDKPYDVMYNAYGAPLTNPYVPEGYGFYEAYFADDKTIYNVNGKTCLADFYTFLDEFGGQR